MLAVSDWFVVTAPFTAETEGLIDAGRLAALKRGAHVVAISRGGIIDEDALVDALRSGRVAGAGLDVTAVEPLPDDSPLWDMENVVISPHASALTPEMWEGRQEIFKENLRRFLAGRALPVRVRQARGVLVQGLFHPHPSPLPSRERGLAARR